jgi:hypothetical protein
MVKMTFSLDDATAARLRRAAERLSKPKSEVVREAIREYAERVGRLSEQERLQMLRAFDDLVPRIPMRPAGPVERELRDLREARRAGGRREGGRKRR